MGGLVAAAHPLPLPQSGVDLSEGRPLVGELVPALHHEGVHPAGAVLGTGQQLAGADHLDHLLVAVAVVRLQRENNKYSVIKLLLCSANKIRTALLNCLNIFAYFLRPAPHTLHSFRFGLKKKIK